jgi:hypothetical protein
MRRDCGSSYSVGADDGTPLGAACRPDVRRRHGTHARAAASATWWPASAPCCDDAGMAALTLEEIAAKIAAAESGFAAATSPYDRNVFAQIRDEYKRYAAERAKEIAKQPAAATFPAS